MTDFTKIFAFFWREYRRETALVVCLIILAGMFEALGVAAFLPFFQIVLEGGSSLSSLPPALQKVLAETGVSLTFVNVGLFIMGAIGLKALVLWASLRKVGVTVARISADLRDRLLRALLAANWRFFVDHSLGTSLNAVINETFRSSMAFVSLARFISALVQFAVYAAGAFLLSPPVFFGALAAGGMLACALWFLVRVARRAGQAQTDLARAMLAQMAEMLQGIKPLRAMALEKSFMTLLSGHSKGLETSQAEQLVSAQTMRVFHEPLMVLTAVSGLYLATTYGHLSTSALAMMAVVFIRMLNSMNNAQTEYQRMVSQESALWSLLDTIRQTEEAAESWPGSAPVPAEAGALSLEAVSFSHGDRQILRDVSLSFVPRTLTALTGESGSGKTTILDLVSGFYRPDTGRVCAGGADLRGIGLGAWRRAIGFVPQEVFLFNDTIAENIRVGRGDIGDDAVWQALEAAGVADFVAGLPDGLATMAGENGRRLSGGQRQRIAIARAIVHRPQILLLDEATSALDRETERVLLETLRRLAAEMTVIFVSHNEAVQDYADAVYHVAGGRVEKAGRAAFKRKEMI